MDAKPVAMQVTRDASAPAGRVLGRVFRLGDLVSLSVSSAGPLFSIAATGGVMAANAGLYTLPAILLLAGPFLVSAFIFRLLNRHFPQAGASYHWSGRLLGARAARFQSWVLVLAYFASIPPIVIPAASYTLQLAAPGLRVDSGLVLALSVAWLLFALLPLLGGGRPTTRITQVFLAVELVALAAYVLLGAVRWPAIHIPLHFGVPPWGGMMVTAVVAATILDGWEIDSYASEEAHRPRRDPGTGGIIGAFGALGFYVLVYPLILTETPMNALTGGNPMAAWGARLLPGAGWAVLIPVLVSTAGGLWLTSFILARALYAMGRERLLLACLGRVSGRGVPHIAICLTMGAVLAVVAAQLLFNSLQTFFTLVLSAAGFFLVLEFFLDSVTALVFLSRVRTGLFKRLTGHHYGALRAGAAATAAI
jgi:amino acid transporter